MHLARTYTELQTNKANKRSAEASIEVQYGILLKKKKNIWYGGSDAIPR